MKKMNSKGFTLIELLAVITIMGILMLVAIPAISRTIENSRRDTFADAAKEYINAVRNAVLADNISCKRSATSTEMTTASGTPDGTYYFTLDQASIKDLMEAGGKSPFGGSNMVGYVKWVKESENGKTTTTYSISLSDTGKHGLSDAKPEDGKKPAPTEIGENAITRSVVITELSAPSETKPAAPSDAIACKLN